MEFVIFLALVAAQYAYFDYQQKQRKAKTIVACREELINAFPAHASQLSEGVAAVIISDASKKKGLATKADAARDKFVKQKDYTRPEDQQSEKTKQLGMEMVLAIFEYHEQVISRLPEGLQAELKDLPGPSRHGALMDAMTRTWARVN